MAGSRGGEFVVRDQPRGDDRSPEPWITKQRLAEHLSVTTRWIELQQRRGLPYIHTPGLNR